MTASEVLRVLAVFERCDIVGDSLMWKIKGENEAWLGMLCNDVFYWGTADVEDIEANDIPMLEACADDLKAIGFIAKSYVPELFCARKRGMRPQAPWGRTYAANPGRYEGDNLDPRVRALFDACGPERDRKDEG